MGGRFAHPPSPLSFRIMRGSDCQPLLRYVKETGLGGIEAITPRPEGDVTLDEIKEALGNDLFLLDG